MDSPINEEFKQQQIIEEKGEKLEEKNQAEDQLKKQVSRRSRKDIEGRDFVCGCGKKYLSYPALYTHIKTKHDGRQPEGTMKYSTVAPAKKTKTKLQQQHLNQMISMVKRQDIKLLDILGGKFIGTTSLSARLKSKILQKQITDTYHSLLKNTTSPLKLGKQNSLQQHLVAYLIGIGQLMTQKLHQQYQWFARTVKQCYYQMGTQVYNKCFSKKQGGLCYVPNFKVQKVKYFPLICDFYIRFFLPYEYSELNINLMELILTDFCNWLHKRRCTYIEIVLNKEYKLLAPLQFEDDIKNEHKNQKDIKNEEDQQDKSHRSQLEDIESQNNDNIKQQDSIRNQSASKSQVNDHKEVNGEVNEVENNFNERQEVNHDIKLNQDDIEAIAQQVSNKISENGHLQQNGQVNHRQQPQKIQAEKVEIHQALGNQQQQNSQKLNTPQPLQVEAAAPESFQSVQPVVINQQKNQNEEAPIQRSEQVKNDEQNVEKSQL